jgi:hypothetical protein
VPKKFVRDLKDEVGYSLRDSHNHQHLFRELIASGNVEDLWVKFRFYHRTFRVIGARMTALIHNNAVEWSKWEYRRHYINRCLADLGHWIPLFGTPHSRELKVLEGFASLHAYMLGAQATLLANEDQSEEKYFAE